jgi:hypothetical protein
VCTVAAVVVVMLDLMIDQGDCGQAQTASSSASVVASAHVKWLGTGREGRAAGHLA